MTKEELMKELEEFEKKTKELDELSNDLEEKGSDLFEIINDNDMIAMVAAVRLMHIFSRFFGIDPSQMNINSK